MAQIRRFRRRPEEVEGQRRRVADAVQLVLTLPALDDALRGAILRAHHDQDGELRSEAGRWLFVMISPVDVRAAMQLIQDTDRPDATLRLYVALLTHLRMDTGEILAARDRLAVDAMMDGTGVSRGLNALARLGIVHARGIGRSRRWYINPRLAWAGSLAKREIAQQRAPQLALVPTERS